MMKRIALFAIGAMVLLTSCQNKVKNNPQAPEGKIGGGLVETTDTVPMPIFLMSRLPYLEMHYWTNVEEPMREGDEDEEWFVSYHAAWERQEAFRHRASQYTHLITNYSDLPIKFFDEVLKDPDGNTPSIGQLHGRDQIPSLCARYKLVNQLEEENEAYGIVAVTDSYLQTRRKAELTAEYEEGEEMGPLPDSIVAKLEKRYGMKASRSLWYHTIDGRYIQGCLQFEGEYKDAPADNWGTKRCLALEVIADSSEVYAHEVLGYYVSENEYGWNVDDEGIYINIYIHTAYEGPNGLEFCYTRSAPESLAVGIAYLRDGKYVLDQYDIYQYMIDEEIPLWKSDIAELNKLYHDAAAEEGKDVVLSKYAHCFFDLENEWVWMRDKEDQHGGIFIRKDGHFQLVGLETPQIKPKEMNRDYKIFYVQFEGPIDSMTYSKQVFAYKDGEEIEEFTCQLEDGEVTECRMDGRPLSPVEGKAYLDNLPEPEEITAYFHDPDSDY